MTVSLQFNMLLGVGLLNAFNQAAAVIEGVGFLAAAASLIGAVISGFGERSVSGMKISLVLAIIAGCAFLVVGSFFLAGGWATQIIPGALN